MPRFIIKLNDGEHDWYMEWSTVVDAPATFGLSLEEFKEYYKEEYGKRGLTELEQRLARVEKNGSSSMYGDTADEIISNNRAGPHESQFTKEQIIEHYCHKREEIQWS